MKHCWQHIICLTAILTVAVMHSCTEVELCENPDHLDGGTHRAHLVFDFDWEKTGGKPDDVDNMMVVANRIINSWREMYIVPLKGDGVLVDSGYLYVPEQTTTDILGNTTTGTNQPEGTEEENPLQPVRVKEGEFQFLTINWKHDECVIDSLKRYGEDLTMASTELFIHYVAKSQEEVESFGRAWTDYNSYGQFIDSEVRPTYVGMTSVHHVQVGSTETVKIRPERITQRYGLHLTIEKEPGVRIEEVVGIIAGIPQRYGLSTKHVDVNYTNKMAFRIPIDDTKIENYDPDKIEALDNETSIPFKTSFNAIGLVRSNEPDYQRGPGILQLCVYTSAKRTDGSGQRASKTIYALINLYNTINEALPMMVTEDGRYMVQNGDSVTLNIPNVLRIEQGRILSDPNEDNSMDKWKEAGRIHVDI